MRFETLADRLGAELVSRGNRARFDWPHGEWLLLDMHGDTAHLLHLRLRSDARLPHIARALLEHCRDSGVRSLTADRHEPAPWRELGFVEHGSRLLCDIVPQGRMPADRIDRYLAWREGRLPQPDWLRDAA